MKTLLTLVGLTLLPISLPAQTVCVYEIDTVRTYFSAEVVGGIYREDTTYLIDTIPHWILITDELVEAVRVMITPCRVDTVYVRDTCDHYYEWECTRPRNDGTYLTLAGEDGWLHFVPSADTTWALEPGDKWQRTGTSQCTYCGKVRRPK